MIKEILETSINEKGHFNINNNEDHILHKLKTKTEELYDNLIIDGNIKTSDWNNIKNIIKEIDKNIKQYI